MMKNVRKNAKNARKMMKKLSFGTVNRDRD